MKTANFTYRSPRSKTLIFGTVTLKNDGKVSISMPGAKYGTSAAERYAAKAPAEAIVKADFNHEAAQNVVIKENPTGLVSLLTEKTQEFKAIYLERTRQWSIKRYEAAQATAAIPRAGFEPPNRSKNLSYGF